MPDIIVIGGGPAGTAAATRAAQLGAQVTLIEQAEMGGNCVNRNCVPLATMLASVELFTRIKQAGEMGISVGSPTLDAAQVAARASQISQELSEGLPGLLSTFGIEIIPGQARLVGPKTVEVNGQQIQASRAVIVATGARWAAPPAGIEPKTILTPHAALALNPIPNRLLVWGGGPVELEFATLYAYLGSKVTLVIEGAHPLPAEDYEVGQRLQGALQEHGLEVITNASVQSTVKSGKKVKAIVTTRRGETELSVNNVLWAGRVANIEGLGLEEIGIKLNPNGSVVVDQYQQTNLAGLYAIGDVTGEPFYSSKATPEGLVAAENAMGQKRQLDRRLIVRHAFTLPEVGCVGLTEDQAEDAGYEIEIVNISMNANSRAMSLNELEGGVKLIADKKYGKILGVHIVGHRATELIAEAVLAIQLEALAEDLAWSVRVHPTLSESMVEAGRAVMGQALYIPNF